MKKQINKLFYLLFCIILCLGAVCTEVYADTEKYQVKGKFYQLNEKSDYQLSDEFAEINETTDNTYGHFFIDGNISSYDEENLPAYKVEDGNLSFFYNYEDKMKDLNEDLWHIVKDKGDTVSDIKLDSKIENGVIIVQVSRDGINWNNEVVINNAFEETPKRTEKLYETNDIQIINGTYYKVIVAYKMAIRTEKRNFLFINTDKYDYKKCVEVYEFRAYVNDEQDTENDNSYSLGQRVRTEKFDGYYGQQAIDEKDPHYGWELGNFFITGYTDEISQDGQNVVFLKNVGDKVTLWFRLNQDIDSLNGNSKLSITSDTQGYDQYFETEKMDFGKGALIIRHTDYNNVKSEPIIYRDYLESNVSIGADTIVQLFEEGDYEVALDYEVTSDELIDKIGHYRIFFEFSVRNGNCMVYPFDVVTGSELTNSSFTENGFKIDLAKSRYLQINLKKETLEKENGGIFIEDTRFNGPAKDGAEYTDEGVYTITAYNQYTNQTTTKKIYVGTDNILKAYVATGMSIDEINKLIDDGATINDDGTINVQTVSAAESGLSDTTSSVELSESDFSQEIEENISASTQNSISAPIILIVIFISLIVFAFIIKKNRT